MKKTILSFMFTFFMAEVCNAQILIGDMNGDGNLNVSDITALVNTILGSSEIQYITAADFDLNNGSDIQFVKGDMNKDGIVDVSDVTKAVNAILGSEELQYITRANFVAKVHGYVDLGLPSGMLWATCNIGADNPEDYGDYFSWGETTGYNSGKTNFGLNNYKWCNGSETSMTKYCTNSSYGFNGFTDGLTELELEDDVASVRWGAEWRIPSKEQYEELINNKYTRTEFITQNAVNGIKITSLSNGNYIFLPAAGVRVIESLNAEDSSGRYCSRTLYISGDQSCAEIFSFDSNSVSVDCRFRECGYSVRPVRMPYIQLDETSISLKKGFTKQIHATVFADNANTSAVTWSSSDETIATVVDGLVTAVSDGTTTITCSTTDESGFAVTCVVLVYTDMSGVINGHSYVDLGLPSGTLWSTCNVGANSPDDYGDYFAWGETLGYQNGKKTFSWSNYIWCEGSNVNIIKYCNESSCGNDGFTDGLLELDLEDDVAYMNWGSDWRIPSERQFNELYNSGKTTTEWITHNGKNGLKITSKINGNSIFLPAAGNRGSSLVNAGSNGYYWSRTLSLDDDPYDAWHLFFFSSGIRNETTNRFHGFCVRPVRILE